jgi:hypothetical protein
MSAAFSSVTTINSIGMISSFGERFKHPSVQKTNSNKTTNACALVERVKIRLEGKSDIAPIVPQSHPFESKK